MLKKFHLLLFFCLSFLGCDYIKQGRVSQPEAIETLSCSEDSDCVLVSKGCCGCHYGGEMIAIPKRSEKIIGKMYQKNVRVLP